LTTLDRSAFLQLSAAAALAAVAPAPAGAQDAPLIRLALTPNDSYAEGLYGQDTGMFKNAGLNVEVNVLASGAAIVAAVAAGAIDIGITNVLPLANAVAHGVPLIYLCSGGMLNLDEVGLCVAADSPIKTAKDFTGKTMASSALADVNTIAMQAWLDQNGGDANAIKFVEIPFPQMAAALKRGTVDAAPIVEPALTIAKGEGTIRVMMPPIYSVYGPKFMLGGWFSSKPWLEKNGALAQRFVAAIYETGRWANSHPDESSTILAKYAKLEPALLKKMARVPYGSALTPDMLQRTLDLAHKYKAIDHPINAGTLIARI
jgi:NitT/TauT family transport system substrate-binding protein